MYIRNGRRLIVVRMFAGFAGTDGADFYSVDPGMSQQDLEDFAWQCGKDHAEMYGVYPREEYLDCDEVSDEDLDSESYSDNIEGWFEDYDPEKHDGLVVGCGGEPKFMEI